MAENLAGQLQDTIAARQLRLRDEAEADSVQRAAAFAAREPLVLKYAEERLPNFIGALTTKLQRAADEGWGSASIRWTSGDRVHVDGARIAMEQTAVHFQEEGLETLISEYDNASVGAANGDLEVRDYIPATEWTTALTAHLPASNS